VVEQKSFWDTFIGGTGEGPEAGRKEKVLQYIIHRLKAEASLREVLQEEYVRRNCTQLEIEEILIDPELVHAAREHMEETFESGELDPGGR
jgi:glutaredoxin-related protein